jgi:type III pantothenate kinase
VQRTILERGRSAARGQSAVAVNELRQPSRAAIVVHVGSAITVNAVSSEGAFLGGAILPGIGMSARALHEFTDLLPLSEMTELRDAPEPLGISTVTALRSGLFWGAVGAMRELTARLGARLSRPQMFLTGGAAPSVAKFLVDASDECACYVPHLTLAGVALSARNLT